MSGQSASPADKDDDPLSQIARLRQQLDALMRDKAIPAAETAVNEAANAMRGQAEALATTVRAQPLTAILIAAAIGFLLGRAAR